MSLVLSVNRLGLTEVPKTLKFSHVRLSRNLMCKSYCRVLWKDPAIPGLARSFMVCYSHSTERPDNTSSEKTLENKQWAIFKAWDFPWDWRVLVYVMMPYVMSILFSGIVGSAGLGMLQPHMENAQTNLQSIDEEAVRLFIDQLLKTVIKLSILYVFITPYRPFPKDIFSYRWDQPLNVQSGWILWGGGGLMVASSSVFVVKALICGLSTSQMQNEVESLVRLLPLIGSSNISTTSLLGILGLLAPFFEETLYRGFLMTSLTKWLPVPVSAVISAAIFTLVHQSPGKSMEIFIFGVVLGLIYAQTRNLLAPITMHACWNLGVIFVLMYFRSQGYDMHRYVL